MSDEKQLPAGPLANELATDYVRRVTASLGNPVPRSSTPTNETKLLGAEGKAVVQRARAWGQALLILVTALAAAVPLLMTAYRSLAEEARARAQAAKQLAEDGFQVTREAMVADRAAKAALERRVAEVEQAMRAGSPDPHRRLRGAVVHRPSPPVVPPAPPPRELPRNLDEAQRQVRAPAPPMPQAPRD